jgi:hypothetical protein
MLLDDISIATRMRRAEADHFTYGANFPIAVFIGAATINVGIPLDADSDFILCKQALVAYTAVATMLANPDYTHVMADTGSGRNLQNTPIHVANSFGTAQLPFILPEPKLFKASSVIQITLINRTAVAAEVFISLIGFKLFYMPNFSREMLGDTAGKYR